MCDMSRRALDVQRTAIDSMWIIVWLKCDTGTHFNEANEQLGMYL